MSDSCFDKDEFEDTKGVIRIRKSKKDRQHNDQKKKEKKLHRKLKIEQHEPH
jgi:hypothetical protein